MNHSLNDLDYLRLLVNSGTPEDCLQNYQRLADFFPALVYVYDSDKNRIGYFNKKFSELLGYEQEDFSLLGENWNMLIFKEDEERFKDEMKKFYELKDGENHSFENRFNRKQGDYRYFRTLGTVMRRNEEGKPAAMLFVAQDITDSFNNSEELKKSKALVAETERLQKYGMFNYDVINDRLTWSDGMYDLFETDKTDSELKLNKEFFRSFVINEEKNKVDGTIEEAYKKGVDFDYECTIVTGHGNEKILYNRVKIIKDDYGKIIRTIGTSRDITKEKLFERELQKTIKDLDSSNKELEEFAYVASHDMQEPLRKITTFSSRLFEKYKGQLGGEGKMYLERMDAAANNMRMLIENLLEISRTTRSTKAFEMTDLNEIVQQVRSDLELKIEEEAVTIISDTLPTLEAIPTQLQQLFNNIFSNSIKFRSPLNKPVIHITAREIDRYEREKHLLPEKTFYEISVKDNGIGFEQEYAEKIFQIFQRLHGKAEYPGSGIGLAICKRIVDKHNGIITAESLPGKGSAFFIILPEKQ